MILSFLDSDDEIDHYGNPIIDQSSTKSFHGSPARHWVFNPGGVTGVQALEMSSLDD